MRKGYEIRKDLYRGYMCWLVTVPSGKTYEIARWNKKYNITFLPDYPKTGIYDADGTPHDTVICIAGTKADAIKAIYSEEEKSA